MRLSDLDHLLLFRDIVQTRSISEGAHLHGVSQSAASQHLQELERRLDVRLLDRSTRPFTVTPAGKLYYELCRDVARRHGEFTEQLKLLKQQISGVVSVAAIYSVGLTEMTRLREEFAARHPGAELRVEYARPERVLEMVLHGEAELGLISYPAAGRHIEVRLWRQEEMGVVVPPRHRLAGASSLDPQQLQGEAFVAFEAGLPIRRHIDRYLRQHGVRVKRVMTFDNLQMVKEAVAVGSGISILPVRLMAREREQGLLVAIPLRVPLTRPLGIICRRRAELGAATKAFLQLLTASPQGRQQEGLSEPHSPAHQSA